MDKRKSKRDDLNELIEFSVAGTDRKIHASLLDLSISGLGFKSDGSLQYGDMLIGNLVTWNKDNIQVIVKVLREFNTNEGLGYGCTFVGMSDADKLKIEMYQKVREGS